MRRDQRLTFKRSRADSNDTIRAMKFAVNEGLKDRGILDLCLSLPNDIYLIFEFVFRCARYFPDKKGKQTVRTFRKLLKDGYGNCVDYSTAISTILKAKGVEHYFKKVSMDGKSFSHIYVVTRKGKVLDCVLGQDESGAELFKNQSERKSKFNIESDRIKISELIKG